MSMSRALRDLLTVVDSGHHIVVTTQPPRSSSDMLPLAPRRSSYYGGGRGSKQNGRQVVAETPPTPLAAAAAASPDDGSFEFSAFVSSNDSSASPASMVFSDGQLRAHEYPAVRSSTPPTRSSSIGSAKAGAMWGSKKRVSFAMDDGPGDDKHKQQAAATNKAGGGNKSSRGLLGCMGSACGSSCNEVVEPTKNTSRNKVLAV